MTSKFKLLPILASLLSLTAPAIAADADMVIAAAQQDEYVPVEIGSGWYIRGDIGVNFGGRHNSDQYDLAAVQLQQQLSRCFERWCRRWLPLQ